MLLELECALMHNALDGGWIMADTPTRASEIRNWLQAFIVVTGVAGGFYQFVFREMLLPAAAPINLSTEVTIREAGFRSARGAERNEQFEAIELAVTAKNPSSRDIYLLANCWHVHGLTNTLKSRPNETFAGTVTGDINKRQPINEGAYYEIRKVFLVAAGGAFIQDQILHPNESVSASFVFYVPQDVYDVLHVHVQLPTTAVAHSAEVEWKVTAEGCVESAYRMRNGVRGEPIEDLYKAFLDPAIKFQAASSSKELSLWTREPPAAVTEVSRRAR